MKDLAACISASHPFDLRLPLPSSRRIMSSVLLQVITSDPTRTLHLFILHCLYCNRFKDHLSAHLPSPSGAFLIYFWRFLVPPSQSLEHADHFVHWLSSQSFSQAWV